MNFINCTLDTECEADIPEKTNVWKIPAFVFMRTFDIDPDEPVMKVTVPIVSIRNDAIKSHFDVPPFNWGIPTCWKHARWLHKKYGRIYDID